MPDRISNYRTIRLVIQPGRIRPDKSYWSLHAVTVARGIPFTAVLLDGFVPLLADDCSLEDIMEAIAAVADQGTLR